MARYCINCGHPIPPNIIWENRDAITCDACRFHCITCGDSTSVSLDNEGMPIISMYCSEECRPPPRPDHYQMTVCLTCKRRLSKELMKEGREHHRECFLDLRCKNGCGRRPTPSKEHCEVCYRLWMANNNRHPCVDVYPYCGCPSKQVCSHYERKDCQSCLKCKKGVVIPDVLDCTFCAQEQLFVPSKGRTSQNLPKRVINLRRSTTSTTASMGSREERLFQTCRCGSGFKFDQFRDRRLICSRCV